MIGQNNRPIGIFDSGLGGLTVFKALKKILPEEDVVYFGDTARVPYGTKSETTIKKFAKQAVEFLLQYEPKIIIAACNSVSSCAATYLKENFEVPVFDVIEPACQAAVADADNKILGVIGTEATISSGAYTRKIEDLDSSRKVLSKACPLFVPLMEEGRKIDDPIVKMAVEEYLFPLKEVSVDALILGCTHYPLLRDAIGKYMEGTRIIDSGFTTAHAVAKYITEHFITKEDGLAQYQFFVSDTPNKFKQLASYFLGHPVDQINLVSM